MADNYARALQPDTVPVIDLAPLLAGEVDGVAAEIYAAATTIGFFYIKGHGIPQATIDSAFAGVKLFYSMPGDLKQTIAVDTDQRGWMGQGMSRMQGSVTHDNKEVFFFGREVAANDPDFGKPLVAPNRWPDHFCPCLKDGLQPYHAALCEVGEKVMRAVAVSLGAEANFFASSYERPPARGAVIDPRALPLDGTEAHHAPVTAGEHIAGRNKKSFSQYSS